MSSHVPQNKLKYNFKNQKIRLLKSKESELKQKTKIEQNVDEYKEEKIRQKILKRTRTQFLWSLSKETEESREKRYLLVEFPSSL